MSQNSLQTHNDPDGDFLNQSESLTGTISTAKASSSPKLTSQGKEETTDGHGKVGTASTSSIEPTTNTSPSSPREVGDHQKTGPIASGLDENETLQQHATDSNALLMDQNVHSTAPQSSRVPEGPFDDDPRARDLARQLQGVNLSTSDRTAISEETSQPIQTPPPPETRHKDTEIEEQWPLKMIAWPPLPPPPSGDSGEIVTGGTYIKIICQNKNGPCSLIALCNVLILRHDITITPASRLTVSYSILAGLVADYLLKTGGDPSQLESVLEVLPGTRFGLTLNPRFGHVDGFQHSGQGELALFRLSKVPLLHGWVPDPQDLETWDALVTTAGDYDRAVELIVEAQELGVVQDGMTEDEVVRAVQRQSQWTQEEQRKVAKAEVMQRFLATSSTQLTYHGLFSLSSILAPSSLSALFRNSHLSVLYRRPTTPGTTNEPQLFTLVTDESFSNEPDVCWESLEDVEGGNATFFDGALRRTSVRGGDWVQSAGARKRDYDGELARQLQDEEYDRRPPDRTGPVHAQVQEQEQPRIQQAPVPEPPRHDRTDKKRSGRGKEKCLMM